MSIQTDLVFLHDVLGYTDKQVAQSVGAAQCTISRLRGGVYTRTFSDIAEAIHTFAATAGPSPAPNRNRLRAQAKGAACPPLTGDCGQPAPA